MLNTEIETCIDWQGPGLALHELGGGTRHRWHCLDCNEKGPAEVDGAVCKYQLGQHIITHHGERKMTSVEQRITNGLTGSSPKLPNAANNPQVTKWRLTSIHWIVWITLFLQLVTLLLIALMMAR